MATVPMDVPVQWGQINLPNCSTIVRVDVPEELQVPPVRQMPRTQTSVIRNFTFQSIDALAGWVGKMDVTKGGHHAACIVCPTGLGKTTWLPGEIARRHGTLVVVVQPFDKLVAATTAYVRGLAQGYSVDADLPGNRARLDLAGPRVLYTTPAQYLLRQAMRQFGEAGHVLLHDESHENDFSTFALSKLYRDLAAVPSYYLRVTATLPDVGARPVGERYGGPRVTEVAMEIPNVAEWTFEGDANPWSCERMRGSRTLIFCDDDANSELLRARYAEYGFDAARFRASDSVLEFEDKMRALNTSATSAVYIADSSFQSGYTFDVDVVIDVGHRRFTGYDETGNICDKYRSETIAERRQRVGRVGRFRDGTAYVRSATLPITSSILAAGEFEHVAAFFHVLGYNLLPEDAKKLQIDLLPEFDAVGLLGSGTPYQVWQRDPARYAGAAQPREKRSTPSPARTYGGAANRLSQDSGYLSSDSRPVGQDEPLRDSRMYGNIDDLADSPTRAPAPDVFVSGPFRYVRTVEKYRPQYLPIGVDPVAVLVRIADRGDPVPFSELSTAERIYFHSATIDARNEGAALLVGIKTLTADRLIGCGMDVASAAGKIRVAMHRAVRRIDVCDRLNELFRSEYSLTTVVVPEISEWSERVMAEILGTAVVPAYQEDLSEYGTIMPAEGRARAIELGSRTADRAVSGKSRWGFLEPRANEWRPGNRNDINAARRRLSDRMSGGTGTSSSSGSQSTGRSITFSNGITAEY